MTEYQKGANEKRTSILEQLDEAGVVERMGEQDRKLLLKLLVWDEDIIDEYGKIAR